MEIRQATVDDVLGVQNVAHISWHHTYEGIVRPDTRASVLAEFYNEESLRRSVLRQDAHFLVAEQDGKIIGFAQALPRPRNEDYELTRLYVLPAWQRKGLGSKLLAAMEARITGRGLWSLLHYHNVAGIAFCESRGFKRQRELELPVFGEVLRMVELHKPTVQTSSSM